MRRLRGGRHRDPAEGRNRLFLAILIAFGLTAATTSLWALDSPLEDSGGTVAGGAATAAEDPAATPFPDIQDAAIRPQDAEEAPTTEAAETTTAAETEEDTGGGGDDDDGGDGGGGGDDDGGDGGGGGDDAPYADAEAEVLRLVNDERAEAGCGALERDGRLDTAARLHAQDMAANDYFSHTSQDGRSPTDRANEQGYPGGVGENIAWGYPDAASVMEGWMQSEGHRANILNCGYTRIGVGAADRDGSIYWVQMFG